MRLLKRLPDGGVLLTDDLPDDSIPSYAILSHRWEQDDQEVTFEDMVKDQARVKTGYRKIEFCGEQAAKDSLDHFWYYTLRAFCFVCRSENASCDRMLGLNHLISGDSVYTETFNAHASHC